MITDKIYQLFARYVSNMYYKKHYKVNDTNLYISNGIGTDKYKFRINSIPSINVYRIKNTLHPITRDERQSFRGTTRNSPYGALFRRWHAQDL